MLIKPFARWSILVVIGLLLGATGCVNFFGNPQTDAPDPDDELPGEYTGKVYQMGSLSGALVEEFEEAVDFSSHAAGTVDGPLVLSGDGLEALGETERASVAAFYAANHPVILLHATGGQINALRQILGFDEFIMPDGMSRAEIYALDHEPDGEVWQWVQYPPHADEQNPDDSEDQEVRVGYLLDWLEENQNRETPAEEDAKLAAKASTNELTQMASAFIDQQNFCEYGNNYQLCHFIYSFHAVNSREDWFYVQQHGMFNGRGGYQGRWADWSYPGDKEIGYMDSIDINTSINNWATNASMVGLIQSSPETANNKTEISSGTKYDVGGEISLDKKGVSAGLSGGISVDYSTSFNVLDCTTYNKCVSEGNNARWTYVFKRCNATVPLHYVMYGVLSNPPALSVSTFQPVNQWIWRMRPEARNLPLSMHVRLQVNRVTTVAKPEFLWAATTVHTEMPGNVFECNVSLPRPPVGSGQ